MTPVPRTAMSMSGSAQPAAETPRTLGEGAEAVPGPEVTLDDALANEWLVADGCGGYASGTVAGPHTRRYHGLLVAPLAPPLGRHVLLSRIEEQVVVDGSAYPLSSSEFEPGWIDEAAVRALRSFRIANGRPTWTIDAGGRGLVERQVWMEDGLTATFIRYAWTGPAACTLVLRPLATSRDFHHELRGEGTWRFDVQPIHPGVTGGVQVRAHRHAPTWHLRVVPPVGARFHWDVDQSGWWWNFRHREERARGFDYVEDLYCLGAIMIDLEPGQSVTLGASLAVDGPAVAARLSGTAAFAAPRSDPPADGEPPLVPSPVDAMTDALRRAAGTFLVRREVAEAGAGGAVAPGWTVLAGYHWFGDWGRDSFIALGGLARLTGRFDVARAVLRSWARVESRGMLPNRFPDGGSPLGEGDFNSVDATLWFVRAVAEVDALEDSPRLAAELWPTLVAIIEAHLAGTRHGIVADPTDGLLRTDDGQLTWMDARVRGIDVTPRAGKPVEVNALWIHGLDRMATWAATAGKRADARRFREAHDRAASAFIKRFWWDGRRPVRGGVAGTGGYLLDAVDGPDGDDGSLRPNQVIAAGMATTPLDLARRRAVVEIARSHLVVPRGLRTLSPADPRYRGQCAGDADARDGAYHQGTAWAWLLGPFVDAWLLAGGDTVTARSFVEPMRDHVWREACVGTVSEIFDGDAPHRPRGAVSQAWSVAEVGRAWMATSSGEG